MRSKLSQIEVECAEAGLTFINPPKLAERKQTRSQRKDGTFKCRECGGTTTLPSTDFLPGTFLCNHCGSEAFVMSFEWDKRHSLDWSRAHAEEKNARQREWRRTHRDQDRLQRKLYYRTHRAQHLACIKKYRNGPTRQKLLAHTRALDRKRNGKCNEARLKTKAWGRLINKIARPMVRRTG